MEGQMHEVVRIAEVVGRYGDLTSSGRNVVACSPPASR